LNQLIFKAKLYTKAFQDLKLVIGENGTFKLHADIQQASLLRFSLTGEFLAKKTL
jgi:hypothetical protein